MNFASSVVSHMHLDTNCQGLNMGTNKLLTSPNSFIAHFGVTSSALYASAPNHVFGQMLGLPGSWVCCLPFRSIG